MHSNTRSFQRARFEVWIVWKLGFELYFSIHKALKPCLIEEYSSEFELLVVEFTVANKSIGIISGYGPQECWSEMERMPFFLALEQEIIKAELAGKSVLIEMDANSKLGPDLIPGDKHPQSQNGQVLSQIIKRHSLVVGNSMMQCSGLVTRKRATKNGVEESTIDFVLLSDDLKDDVDAIIIDDVRECVLTSLTKVKNGVKKTESDHNTIFTRLKFKWNMDIKEKRIEMFNLKNKSCQEAFKEATTAAVNNKYLSTVFDEEGDINELTEKFLKRLNKSIHKCFRKIKIKAKVNKEEEDLYSRWKDLRKRDDTDSKIEMEEVENELSKKYYEKITMNTGNIDPEVGGVNSGRLWDLKRQMFPKCRDPLTAMKDPLSGNILTTNEKINEAAVNVFSERLKNRPIKNTLQQIKEAKERLCKNILEVSKRNKTPDWNMKELEVVLKNLKKEKSRDPMGHANEIFRPEVAGTDFKKAILKLMNKIKETQIFPETLKMCNISSIWKRKQSRNDFDNYRGIFRVNIFRSILDRMIYNDEYATVEESLTDSNVGARKGRNIRDNLFVINAITNSVLKDKLEPIDLQLYDVEKCFDALWLQECINDLYDAGLTNDKLPILFQENQTARVAVKTQEGISNRIDIKNIVMQGTVWGSLFCTTSMEKLGKYFYENKELLYMYKNEVEVPPLCMVDDILGVQKCTDSKKINGAINAFIEMKQAQNLCIDASVGQR